MILSQGGCGAKAVIAIEARAIPFARVYLSDFEGKRVIVDVENPTETRWGDLAREISKKDRPTIGFEFHGRTLERFHAIADPRNADADINQLFLPPPRDPIHTFMQTPEIRILFESGDEKLRAIAVTPETTVAHLAARLARLGSRALTCTLRR
jgi:hypothetical protein